MPRRLRSIERGTVYHLISRFVAREWFIESARERQAYLSLLGDGLAATDWRCFAYAIMSNHVHLAVVAGTSPLASWLRPAHAHFAQWLNEERRRIGAVFVRGPNAIAVRPDGVARVVAYIHCNPVRAGVVSRPVDSEWTSHRAYLGFHGGPRWLDVDAGVELAGFDDRAMIDDCVSAVGSNRACLDGTRLHPRRTPGRARVPVVPASVCPVKFAGDAGGQ